MALSNNGMQRTRATALLSCTLRGCAPLIGGVRPMTGYWYGGLICIRLLVSRSFLIMGLMLRV
jgi:hypothetical protein